MTPANKGSVIERRVGRQGEANQHSPGERSEGSSRGVTQGPGSDFDGNPGPAVLLDRDRSPAEDILEPGAGQHPDEVLGEATPLHERLIVAPCPGRFRAGARSDKASGEYILQGQEIGSVISSDREVVPVKSPFSGWIMGYLVPEGSPVRVAEPVAWLRPH